MPRIVLVRLALAFGLSSQLAWLFLFISLAAGESIFEPNAGLAVLESLLAAVMSVFTGLALKGVGK